MSRNINMIDIDICFMSIKIDPNGKIVYLVENGLRTEELGKQDIANLCEEFGFKHGDVGKSKINDLVIDFKKGKYGADWMVPIEYLELEKETPNKNFRILSNPKWDTRMVV